MNSTANTSAALATTPASLAQTIPPTLIAPTHHPVSVPPTLSPRAPSPGQTLAGFPPGNLAPSRLTPSVSIEVSGECMVALT